MKKTLKDWFIAMRPWSFPASSMPVVATLCYLYWAGHTVDWVGGVWALVAIVAFHAAGNTWSDYFDFKHRVDASDTYGVKTLTSGQFSPKEIFCLSLGLLAVALLLGVGLLCYTDWSLLYVGLGGVVCTLLYPALKYRALGDVVIFFAYALLPVSGTSYVATGVFHPMALWLVLPIGLITVAILHANNTRDVYTDERAGIHTLPMRLSLAQAVVVYKVEVLFPFLWIAVCVACGVFPLWSLLVLLAFKPAWVNAQLMSDFVKKGRESIASLDERTAKLQLMFSVLLALSFGLAVIDGIPF